MKKFLICLLLMFSITSYSYSQSIKDDDLFVVVGKTNDFALLLDINSVIKKNNFVFAKTVIFYINDNTTILPNKKVKNIIRFTQYDCNTNELRTGKKIFLDESLKILAEEDKLDEWYSPKELTIGKIEIDFMCVKEKKNFNNIAKI